MDGQERQQWTEQSNTLRLELKVWEKSFAASNNGKKASRDDIKQHPNIAAKYKEYNRLRDALSGKAVQPPPTRQTPRKRKHEDVAGYRESKRQQINKTPLKTSLQPWEVDPYDSPSVIRNLFTPSRKALGPTPQKDGQVLGLFDLLPEEGVVDSPSKANGELRGSQIPIQATPRKEKTGHTFLKPDRTPASSKKRSLLDAFATPLKNRDSNENGGRTPSSVSKLSFSTPSFLRRDNRMSQLPTVNETEEGAVVSPQMVRVPRKPMVRGLSSILAGLRNLQDDAADEDLEALHEMEADIGSENTAPPKPTVPKEMVLVEDSQPGFPLGAFDDEAMYDSDPEEVTNPTLGRDGQPLKVYKKKGQKRTTRRVNMKPTRSKPQARPEALSPVHSEDELAGLNENIPETQVDEFAGFTDARNFDSDSQSEYTASEGGTRYRRPKQRTKNKEANKDGKVKTAARKVGALAHQNFKRLKLRNSGAKGGPAHNSRFRRRK